VVWDRPIRWCSSTEARQTGRCSLYGAVIPYASIRSISIRLPASSIAYIECSRTSAAAHYGWTRSPVTVVNIVLKSGPERHIGLLVAACYAERAIAIFQGGGPRVSGSELRWRRRSHQCRRAQARLTLEHFYAANLPLFAATIRRTPTGMEMAPTMRSGYHPMQPAIMQASGIRHHQAIFLRDVRPARDGHRDNFRRPTVCRHQPALPDGFYPLQHTCRTISSSSRREGELAGDNGSAPAMAVITSVNKRSDDHPRLGRHHRPASTISRPIS